MEQEKYWTCGTVTDLETGKEYKLGNVEVTTGCLVNMATKTRTDCVTHVIGGNGLVAIEGTDGRLRIEEVKEAKEDIKHMPTLTHTLVAYDIKDYMITEE